MKFANEMREKKLLILGGNALSCDIVNAARRMRIHTIVTDWNDVSVSPAKRIADEYYDISLTDYEALLDLIKEREIDGVITGFTDSYLEIYSKICNLAGLPCYATKEQFHWTLDKKKFKDKCIQYGIPVVPEYSLHEIEQQQYLPCKSIILKPVDNSGSRGIYIVDNYSAFKEKLNKSLEYSKKKHVIVERYMDCDDVSLCYTLRDGIPKLSAICDRYIHQTTDNGSVTSCLIYPSKYLNVYLEKLNPKVINMLKGENLRNGVLFMQAFVENDEFYFYEMGYRLSGGRHYIFTKAENQISALDELIDFSISGKMNIKNTSSDTAAFSSVYSQLSILCSNRRIGSFKGLDWLNDNPNIIDYSLNYQEGDIVGPSGTTMQIVARIHIKAKDRADLKNILESIRLNFKVLDEYGNGMIEDFFSLN